MSLHGYTPVVPGSPRAWFRRWYQGPDVAITPGDGEPVRLTPNHPVLTHIGWRAAYLVEPADWVVVYDPAPTLPIGVLHEAAAEEGVPYPLPVFGRDFRGDGDHFGVEAYVCDPTFGAEHPLTGGEGELPDVDRSVVRGVLAELSSAYTFGRATWETACHLVPRLDRMWPYGEPSARSAGIPELVVRRLVSAIPELPEPAVDHHALSRALLGLPGTVRLVPVTATGTGDAGGYVHDVVDHAGCYVAGGLVVG